MTSKAKQFEGRLYLGRDESGREQYEWVGRFATAKERDDAVMRRRWERESEDAPREAPTRRADHMPRSTPTSTSPGWRPGG